MSTLRRWSWGLAILALASCSVPSGDASIDGLRVESERLESLLADLNDSEQITVAGGRAVGDEVRAVLDVLLRGAASALVLTDAGQSVTDADVAAVRAQLESDPSIASIGSTLIDVIVELNSTDLALDRVTAPSDSVLAERYARRPASLGLLCARHVVVETRSEADAVLRELRAGADFATVAARTSIEPAAATTGGALGRGDAPCLRLTDYQESFDPAFTAGALQARAAVPYGPVQSSFGWHVILIRPFSEVVDDVRTLYAAEAGQLLVSGRLATGDVRVPSRIGRWDPATGRTVARP